MSSRLRKMMGKRSLKDMPLDPGEVEAEPMAEQDTVDTAEPVARNDLSNIPPPPADKIEAVRDPSRKISPSKALLDRYKTRSASSLTAERPTIRIPSVSPRSDADSPSPKGTSFKNDFDMYKPSSSNTEQAGQSKHDTSAAAQSPSQGKQIRVKLPPKPTNDDSTRDEVSGFTSSEYRGVRRGNMKMPDANRHENKVPASQGVSTGLSSRRKTRSSSRRKERADSHDADSKDSTTVDRASDDVPPALTIRKSTASPKPLPPSPKSSPGKTYNVFDLVGSIPGPETSPLDPRKKDESDYGTSKPASPTSHSPASKKRFKTFALRGSGPGTVDKEDEPEVDEPEVDEPEVDTAQSTTPDQLQVSIKGLGVLPSLDVETELEAEAQSRASRPSTPPPVFDDFKPEPPKSPRRLSRLRISRSHSKKESVDEKPGPKDSPVAVRPPIYDKSKRPNQQWESDLGSTSRPIGPWMYSKRWLCCHCKAQTIVEQTVCCNVLCAHDRCPSNCRAEKYDRFRGPYSGPFVKL